MYLTNKKIDILINSNIISPITINLAYNMTIFFDITEIKYYLINFLNIKSIGNIICLDKRTYGLISSMPIYFEIMSCLSHRGRDKIFIRCLFLNACERGYLRLVSNLCVNDFNQITHVLDQGLIMACANHHIDTIKFLIKMGANINTNNGLAIQLAFLTKCEEDLLKFFLKYDISKFITQQFLKQHITNINTKMITFFASELLKDETQHNDILLEACRVGNLDLVKFLVNTSTNAQSIIDSAFARACQYGHFDLVQFLVEHGADVNTAELNFSVIRVPCHLKMNIVKYLVECGMNISSNALLYSACKRDCLDIVKYLVEHGANIHLHNDLALQIASEYGSLSVVVYLVENGANIHAESDAAFLKTNHIYVIKYFLENGVDVQTQNNLAIKRACRANNLDNIKLLINHGADVNVDNGSLLSIEYRPNLEIVTLLLKNGYVLCHEHYTDFFLIFREACEFASKYNTVQHWDRVNFYMEYRLRYDISDESLFQYIKMALIFDYFDIAKVLIESGANIHIHNEYLLMCACLKKRFDIAKLLIERGANIYCNPHIFLFVREHNLC